MLVIDLMNPATHAIEIPIQVQGDRPKVVRNRARACFSWSIEKICVAALVLLGAAMPAAVGVAVSGTLVSWLCLAWLFCVAVLLSLLAQRAKAEAIVLTIDERGIFDRRLMSKHIAWHEIEVIYPVDTNRGHVVDLSLRWPATTLAETRWAVRIGAACQRAYNVPAVTISMLLLDGHVSDLLDAIAQYRPDLLHWTNRANETRRGALEPPG